jgi:hypothetical protein
MLSAKGAGTRATREHSLQVSLPTSLQATLQASTPPSSRLTGLTLSLQEVLRQLGLDGRALRLLKVRGFAREPLAAEHREAAGLGLRLRGRPGNDEK